MHFVSPVQGGKKTQTHIFSFHWSNYIVSYIQLIYWVSSIRKLYFINLFGLRIIKKEILFLLYRRGVESPSCRHSTNTEWTRFRNRNLPISLQKKLHRWQQRPSTAILPVSPLSYLGYRLPWPLGNAYVSQYEHAVSLYNISYFTVSESGCPRVASSGKAFCSYWLCVVVNLNMRSWTGDSAPSSFCWSEIRY